MDPSTDTGAVIPKNNSKKKIVKYLLIAYKV